MALESFYGGRQGASFVIVKHYDGINADTTITGYTGAYLAITSDSVNTSGSRTYLYVDNDFIYRTRDNYADYAWQYTVLDGAEVPTKTSETANIVMHNKPTKAADFMVPEFKKGGDSVDVVNYGEYVIIDSPNKAHPDNGKVFRRGLTFNDDLGGAEYIGQITGPAGEAPNIGIESESIIKQQPGYSSGDYTKEDGDLVPGRIAADCIDAGNFTPGTTYANVLTFLNSTINTPVLNGVYKAYNNNAQAYNYAIYTRNIAASDNFEFMQLSKDPQVATKTEYYRNDFYFTSGNVRDFIASKVRNPNENTLYKATNAVDPNNLKYEYVMYAYNLTHASNELMQVDPGYNDTITYSWVNMRDQYGNIEGALIGFTTPYFVADMIAVGVDAYYNKNTDGTTNTRNLIERIDNGQHPYYQSWKISVPAGIQGKSITKLERINTEVQEGVDYYSDVACTNKVGTTTTRLPLDTDNINFEATFIPVVIGSTTYYVKNDTEEAKKNNTTTAILRYIEIDYTKSAVGEKTFKKVADYNVIRSTILNDYGDLSIDYTHDNLVPIGRIKLNKSTLAILCVLPNSSRLFDDNNTPIPPEYMEYAEQERASGRPYIYDPTVGKNEAHVGWLIVVDDGLEDSFIYNYDYILNQWYSLGTIQGNFLDPLTIINFSPENNEPSTLSVEGMWIPYKTRICV